GSGYDIGAAEFEEGGGALPSVSIQATVASASEAGPADGVFTISRTGSTGGALSVDCSIGGTATIGVDYTTSSSSVVIPAGASSVQVVVTPIDDTLVEGNETVVLTILPRAWYAVGTSSAVVTIADNDSSGGSFALSASPTSVSPGGSVVASW